MVKMTSIAVIGVGGWGKNHVRVLSELGVLAALCDTDAERARSLAEKYKVRWYTSLRDMLDSERLDGAIISTPTSTHFEIARQVLERGISTLIEKPFTRTVSEGEELIKIARDTILTAGYIERFNPVVSHTRDLLLSKSFGDTLMIEFHRENRRPLNIRDVGIILDTSVHDIDTALYLFDDKPNLVFTRSGSKNGIHEEFAAIVLGFSNNRVAFIASNWITPKKRRSFNVICTEAIISGDFITQELRIEQEANTIIPRLDYMEPLTLELKNFIGAIEHKNKPLVSAESALNTLRVAEAALLSSQTGSQIYLEVS